MTDQVKEQQNVDHDDVVIHTEDATIPNRIVKLMTDLKIYVLENYRTPQFWFIVIWLVIVIVSGALVFMAMVGMIKFATVEEMNLMVEVNSQILNFMFTITAFINQPSRAANLLFLIDERYTELKKTYTWASSEKHLELWIVLLLLNFNCLFQYPIAMAMWAYFPSVRPNWVIYTFLVMSFGCAIAGGILEGLFAKKKAPLLENAQYNLM